MREGSGQTLELSTYSDEHKESRVGGEEPGLHGVVRKGLLVEFILNSGLPSWEFSPNPLL